MGIVEDRKKIMEKKTRLVEDKYDQDGYSQGGYDRNGYDRNGYNKEGYDRHGYHMDGYNKEGYNREGYDRNGHKRERYDPYEKKRNGKSKKEKTILFKKNEKVDKGRTCDNCMEQKKGNCFGKLKICDEFRYSPMITQEEKGNWPTIMDASYYRYYSRPRW